MAPSMISTWLVLLAIYGVVQLGLILFVWYHDRKMNSEIESLRADIAVMRSERARELTFVLDRKMHRLDSGGKAASTPSPGDSR